ncbi:hypothetical protein D9M68_952450 [compost metagenome]
MSAPVVMPWVVSIFHAVGMKLVKFMAMVKRLVVTLLLKVLWPSWNIHLTAGLICPAEVKTLPVPCASSKLESKAT